MRPLTGRTVRSSSPLFWRGLAVCGCSGGGKGRLRGVGPELDGGLVGGPSEVGAAVADFLLAGVDDRAGGGGSDGSGDVLTKLLKAAAQLFQQGVRRQGRFGGQACLLRQRQTGDAPSPRSWASLSG